jgi:membrane protein required for colicin V production
MMAGMNILDVGLVVIVAAFIVYGAVKGVVRLALGSVAVAVGLFLGCWYNAPVAAMMAGYIQSEPVRRLAALGLIFLTTLAAFAVLVWFITKTLESANLRWVDRLSGALVGIAIASLLAAALLVPLTAFLPADSTLVGGSALSPYVLKISSFVKALVPAEVKEKYEAARARMKEAGKGMLPGGRSLPVPPSVPEVIHGIESLKTGSAAPAKDPNAKAPAPVTAKKPAPPKS